MPRRRDSTDARRGGGHERRTPGAHGRARDARGSPPALQAGANVAYGIHPVRVLLRRSPQRVRRMLLSSSRDAAARLQELRVLAEQAGIAVVDADDSQLDRLADGERHQGVIVELAPRAGDPETQLAEALESLGEVPPLLLVLDGITDPHNLGACLRSAAAVGVHAVIAPADRAAGLNATVRKVACGAAEIVPFISVTNLARALRDLQEQGLWIVGAAGEARDTLYQVDFTPPTAIVLGAEEKGLRRLTRETCDRLARIPMAEGGVESLNVSVAAGIFLFEARRQRGLKG